MNSTILKKAIDELKSSSPKIDYVLGLLEAMDAMGGSSTVEQTTVNRPVVGSSPTRPADEGSMLDAKARASIESIKSMSKSMEGI